MNESDELAALHRDAQRYRWMRDNVGVSAAFMSDIFYCAAKSNQSTELDELVDTAMATLVMGNAREYS